VGSPKAKLWPKRARSVRENWLAWLPAEKDGLFEAAANRLEIFYSMLSIALDEAFELRAKGALVPAREQAGVCADLFDRLSACLFSTLRAMEDHGRHFGTLPNVSALNPEFFRGETAQHSARRSGTLHRVLFSGRSRFFHKLRALAETVEALREEFREAAEELADGSSVQPGAHWQALDFLHYDLNTCLREAVVVLKCFLCVLPNEEVQPFRQKLQAFGQWPREKTRVRATYGSP
jgi:hypothetical protein